MPTILRSVLPPSEAPLVTSVAPRGCTVLVCESQAAVSDALREVLYGMPGVWRAASATSVLEARREAARLLPEMAIVTTHLRGGDAIAAVRAIRGEVPRCLIVLVPPSEDAALLLRGARVGVRGYLTMRSQVSDFISVVESLLDGDVAIPPEMMGLVWDDLIGTPPEEVEDPRLARLSGREREVLCGLAEGGNKGSIAKALFISPDTVRSHLQHIFTKLEVRSKLQAVSVVMNGGWMQNLARSETRTSDEGVDRISYPFSADRVTDAGLRPMDGSEHSTDVATRRNR